MDARQAIRQLIGRSGTWSQNRLGMQMGLTSQAMGNRMSPTRSDVRAGFLIDALGVLGYDLVAVPKGSRLPNGSLVIDGKREG